MKIRAARGIDQYSVGCIHGDNRGQPQEPVRDRLKGGLIPGGIGRRNLHCRRQGTGMSQRQAGFDPCLTGQPIRCGDDIAAPVMSVQHQPQR